MSTSDCRVARPLAALSAAACLLGACTVGPDYHRPELALPAQWSAGNDWPIAQPADDQPKGHWWTLFQDPELNRLQSQLTEGNASLAGAHERLAAARSQAQASRAARFPQIGATAGAQRSHTSADRPLGSYAVPNASTTQNDLTGSLSVRYETDLFGATSRLTEAAEANAGQAEADLNNVALILQTELTADYLSLRQIDLQIGIVRQTIQTQTALRDLVQYRHDLGQASALDLAQSQAQLDALITQQNQLGIQRQQFEHAIATLTGHAAPDFHLSAQTTRVRLPVVPLAVPSQLLQRRPDIASAERAVASANARVGVAKAAFYPDLSLGISGGTDATALGKLFSASSLLWALGGSATQVVFDGGRLDANLNGAQADYRASVAQYRQTVLAAMQEVEDGMSQVSQWSEASHAASAAHDSARQATELVRIRYTEGMSARADLLTAQQTEAQLALQQTQTEGQQLLASVFLIKALGGTW
jgi:NodT family efflux transporter outer membrane factor (OMF) lipoprotein